MYAYVRLYTSMHVCLYVHMHVWIYSSMYLCIYDFMIGCIHACLHVCRCIRTCICICICKIYVCIYIYTQVYDCWWTFNLTVTIQQHKQKTTWLETVQNMRSIHTYFNVNVFFASQKYFIICFLLYLLNVLCNLLCS